MWVAMIVRKGKPKYGFTAWRYFAWMGVLGLIGLGIAVAGGFLNPPSSVVLMIAGLSLALVGFYTAASYVVLYNLVLREKSIKKIARKSAKLLRIKGDEKILDVGCGTGRASINLAKQLTTGKVVGIDIFKGVSGTSPARAYENAEIEGVAGNVEFRHGNVLHIPFKDNTFDIVNASSVLHEIHGDKNRQKAMEEIYRVLRPGGKFITVEILRKPKLFAIVLFFSFVWKTKKYWEDIINQSGFRNLKVSVFKGLFDVGLLMAEKPPKFG